MEASENINAVNEYADYIIQSPVKSETKKLHIRMFLLNVESVKDYLYPVYNSVRNLQSYKELESIDFNDTLPPVDRNKLNKFILRNYY